MNLVTQFLAVRRDRLLMRLGCWLVCFSLVLGLLLPQQRAEALVAELTMASVASVAAAYLCACGLPFITQGMDKDALVSSVQRLIQEFLDTELGGISIRDWLGNIWSPIVIAGKLLLGRPLTDELMGFAQWVAGKYATQVGDNVVYENLDRYPTFPSAGLSVVYNYPFSVDIRGEYSVSAYCNLITPDFHLSEPGNYVVFHKNDLSFEEGNYFFFRKVRVSGGSVTSKVETDVGTFTYIFISENDLVDGPIVVDCPSKWAGPARTFYPGDSFPISLDFCYIAYADAVLESLSIDRAPSMSYIPEGIAAEQGIALDVGAAETMDLDLVLQGVLDDVIAGELTSTMTAAEEGVENPPVEEELPDVSELGLPALGQALTSRFPFSIPWDFFRAVQLLAAPAKAPRFEVDFLAPIEHRVGQWQGDTTVVLDFSEYAIIGQVCRWTSTIGFCLMLAGATKRLIWTA